MKPRRYLILEKRSNQKVKDLYNDLTPLLYLLAIKLLH